MTDVRFTKADVEGSERAVREGARDDRARPFGHPAPAVVRHPRGSRRLHSGYDAVPVQRGHRIAALPAIAALGKNTGWGTDIETRNVLFLPR